MKKNEIYSFIKESFFEGFKKVTPFVFFGLILSWLFGLLLRGVEIIEKLFPQTIVNILNLPEPVVRFFEVMIVCILILSIGIISKQENMSKRFEVWLIPVIHRIPLLGFLYKITNQVSFNLKDTSMFKEAVYVEIFYGIYRIGFVVGDSLESCCEVMGKEGMKSVIVPFYPFTSADPMDVEPERLKPTGMTVAEATAHLISLKKTMATRKRGKNENEERQKSPTLI